jgi:hypothetical protein
MQCIGKTPGKIVSLNVMDYWEKGKCQRKHPYTDEEPKDMSADDYTAKFWDSINMFVL